MNSHSRDGFYSLWTLAILLCVGACLFLLAYVSFTHGRSAPAAELTPEPSPTGEVLQVQETTLPADVSPDIWAAAGENTPAPSDSPASSDNPAASGLPADSAVPAQPSELPVTGTVGLVETADLGQEYQDKIVFMGDSTTLGLTSYGLLPASQVWVPASGTFSLFNWEIESIDYHAPDGTSQALSIADCASTGQPEYLVITLGVNGVTTLDESSFKDYYLRLVQTIQQASPGTRIMCDSIFPVIDGKAPSGITNAMVNQANNWIQDVVAQTGTRYLNTRECLADSSGQLIGELEAGDGLHVTAEGYERILTYVRTHGYQ